MRRQGASKPGMSEPGRWPPVLTIDGPSGVGKGAVSHALARALGWHVLDSGAVYRALTLAALERSIAIDEVGPLVELCRELDLDFEVADQGIEVRLDGRRVGPRLRGERLSQLTSRVAAHPEVRRALLDLQRSYRRAPGLIADGRDMGTVVFADAPLKVFLDASVEERARRRYKQLKEKGESVTFSRLFRALEERDRRDRERAVSPTLPAPDAMIIDSTSLSLDEVVALVLDAVDRRISKD